MEPSIADVIKAIEAAPDLTATKKTHWSCSLRQICMGIGRPAESIPGRWSGVEVALRQLHHARLGCGPKTLANHKANARGALIWFDGVKRPARSMGSNSHLPGRCCGPKFRRSTSDAASQG